MSVFYRLHQDQSVGTKKSGKWYARMVPTSCINTRQLAEIMQRNCTVKKASCSPPSALPTLPATA